MKYLFNTASQLFAEHLHAVPAALISYKRGKESRHGELWDPWGRVDMKPSGGTKHSAGALEPYWRNKQKLHGCMGQKQKRSDRMQHVCPAILRVWLHIAPKIELQYNCQVREWGPVKLVRARGGAIETNQGVMQFEHREVDGPGGRCGLQAVCCSSSLKMHGKHQKTINQMAAKHHHSAMDITHILRCKNHCKGPGVRPRTAETK